MISARGVAFLLGLALAAGTAPDVPAQPALHRHGLAMHGDPALPAGFSHLPYANPSAPRGGRIVNCVLGGFDSVNPFVVRGVFPPNVITNNVVEPLMARSPA